MMSYMKSGGGGDDRGGTKGSTATSIGKAAAGVTQAMKDKIKKGWGDYPAEQGGKAGQVRYGCGDGVPKDAPYFHRLESDLANSYYWTGRFWQDYVFFVANWHALLGMFCCHPNHPWTKFVRLEMFLISLAITMVPSALIGTTFEANVMFSRTGLILVCVTLPDIIVGVVLYQLAIARSRCPNTCGACVEGVKKCCIIWVAGFFAAITGLCYLWLNTKDVSWNHLFMPLIEGRLWSFLMWFPIWFFLPCQLGFWDLWSHENRAAAKGAAGEMVHVGPEAAGQPQPQQQAVDGMLLP